jgi:polysaccharide pyruvyl transferase WcaK-like protein
MIGRVIDPNKLEVENDRASDTLGEWVSAYDMLHVVGGADLNDIFPQECWERCCLIQTFASQGKPVILTGQQIGPFYSSVTRHSLLRALRDVKFIGLRESGESVQICKQARIGPDRFAVMGDDSFGLPAAGGEEINSLLGQFGLSPGKFIAANLRIGSYIPGTMKYIQVVADCLSYISRRYGIPVVIIPISLDEGDSDVSSGYRLCEVVNEDWIHILDRGNLTAGVVKGIVGQAYAAVGVSYHLCTFALSQGVPAVALFEGDYYAQKARGLSMFWEEERIAMPLDRLNSREAIREVTDLIEDNAFRERLQIRAERAKRRWKEMFDLNVAEMLSRFSTSSPACLTSSS